MGNASLSQLIRKREQYFAVNNRFNDLNIFSSKQLATTAANAPLIDLPLHKLSVLSPRHKRKNMQMKNIRFQDYYLC